MDNLRYIRINLVCFIGLSIGSLMSWYPFQGYFSGHVQPGPLQPVQPMQPVHGQLVPYQSWSDWLYDNCGKKTALAAVYLAALAYHMGHKDQSFYDANLETLTSLFKVGGIGSLHLAKYLLATLGKGATAGSSSLDQMLTGWKKESVSAFNPPVSPKSAQ